MAAYKKFQKLERIRQDPIIHNGTAIEQSRLAQENTLELSPNGVPPASRIFADDTLSQSPVREAFLDDSTKGNSSTSPINCTFNATEPLLSTCTQDENGRKRPASVLSEKPSTERSASFQAKDGRTSGFKDYIKRMSITSRWSSRSSGQFLDSTLERTSLRPSHLSYVQPKAADAVTVAKAKAPPENRSYQYPDIGEVLEEDPVVSYLIWAHHVGVNDGLEFPVIAIRLEELISQGARVNGRTSRGETPLHLVARAGNVPACWVLLKNGASTSAVTNEGQSITAYVRAYKNDPNTDVGMYGHLLWCISLIECGSATLSAECPRLEMDERPPSPKRHRHERSSGLPQTMAALSEEDSQESSFHQLLANANMDSRVDRVSGEASVISPAPYTPPLQEQSDRVRQAESMLDEAASSWMDETWRQVQMQNQQRAFGLQSPNQAPSLTGGSSWQSSPGPSSYPALNARHYFSSTSDNSWAKVGTDGLPMAPSFNTGALDTQCSTRNLVPGLDQQNGERDTEVASTETPLQSTSWSLCVHGYEYNYLYVTQPLTPRPRVLTYSQGVIMLFWLSTDAR